jgi:hypothetical protein
MTDDTRPPQRIQLRRTKGWRKPAGAVVVSRPSKWGNPWRADTWSGDPVACRRHAVQSFRRDLVWAIEEPWTKPHTIRFRIIAESLAELRGHDLACWCPLDSPCHADVLLELANA